MSLLLGALHFVEKFRAESFTCSGLTGISLIRDGLLLGRGNTKKQREKRSAGLCFNGVSGPAGGGAYSVAVSCQQCVPQTNVMLTANTWPSLPGCLPFKMARLQRPRKNLSTGMLPS